MIHDLAIVTLSALSFFAGAAVVVWKFTRNEMDGWTAVVLLGALAAMCLSMVMP